MKITFDELYADYTTVSEEDIQQHAEEFVKYEYYKLVKNWNLEHNLAMTEAKESYKQYKAEIKK